MLTARNYEKTNFITGLRAIAVFWVFLIHAGGGGLSELGGAYSMLVNLGRYGVQMFFVISGFTIFHQLFEGDYTLKRFLLIRASRISIPYFPILLLIYTYINLGGVQFNYWADKFNNGEISIKNLFVHLTYIAASFDLQYTNTIIGVEWTLHIELFFYLILGYFISKNVIKLTLSNIFIHFLLWFFIAFFILELGFKNEFDMLLIHWTPFRFGWMFLLGGAGYCLRDLINKNISPNKINIVSNVIVSLSVCLVLILLNAETIYKTKILIELFVALFTFLLITFTRDEARFSVLLINPICIFLGSMSFSFYLIHYIVISTDIVGLMLDITNKSALFIANLVLTILISFIWYKIFEQNIYQKTKLYINRHY